MAFLDLGNNTGWQIDDGETVVDEQQAKVDALLLLTEKSLQLLEKVSKIYIEYGDAEAFTIYQSRVNEVMKKANYESFFNDDNYENTGQ